MAVMVNASTVKHSIKPIKVFFTCILHFEIVWVEVGVGLSRQGLDAVAWAKFSRTVTRILLVGGPDFFERVMEGAALAIPESDKHATNRKARKVFS